MRMLVVPYIVKFINLYIHDMIMTSKTIKIITAGQTQVVTIPATSYGILTNILRRLGYRPDPGQEVEVWVNNLFPYRDENAENILRQLGIKLPMVDYRFMYRNPNYVFIRKELFHPEDFEYIVVRYKRVSCEEYCEDAVNYDRCLTRCSSRRIPPVKKVDEVIQLYKDYGKDIQVPRGLLGKLFTRYPNAAGLEFANVSTPVDNNEYQGLREYQVRVAKSTLEALRRFGGAINQVATGGGKSYVAGWYTKQLSKQGYNVVVTSLSIDLTMQLQDFAKRWGADVTAVTIQTLWRRIINAKNGNGNGNGEEMDEEEKEVLQYMDEQELSRDEEDRLRKIMDSKNLVVIIDEIHHMPAKTVKAIATFNPYALRIGLSATPWRNDMRDLEIEAWTGPIVEPKISSSYLIEHGYAVPVDIELVQVQTRELCREIKRLELSEERSGQHYMRIRKAVAECEERNKAIAKLVTQVPKPVLVLTSLVKHANTLGELVRKVYDPGKIAVVTGIVKGEVRKKIFDDVRSGKIDILVATTLADEGLDLPPLRSLVLTLGGKSRTRTLQRIGRLVRPFQGKERAVAYDLVDQVIYFYEQAQIRKELYETEPMWRIREVPIQALT